ncbi:MAG: N-acetyl sugar amidotransferase [Gammaproteobacteria bacterium]|nr:N-acetyl sugar amidotransferase [Gammaproteobacteria bacterium]
MKYCTKCLTTALRPNASFNAEGVCTACEYSADVGGRSFLSSLDTLVSMIQANKAKRKKHPKYDCIVGVSGGKDSTRQAHWVRDRLGLNPLLVCCGYPPLQMTDVGAHNMSNLISMGFDVEIITPAPKSSARLSLFSFRKFGNVCKSTEMALYSAVPRIAILKKIPLVLWGENDALQVGDAAAGGENYFDGNNLRNLNTLTEGGIEWVFNEVDAYKAQIYIYPSKESFDKVKLDIMYLGPAWDDWSNDENSIYAALTGLTLRPDDIDVTGDISGASMLDEEFTNINMMIKYYKFGFGRTTDTCNERIRAGVLTKECALGLVDRYDGVCDDSIILRYCNYVNITVIEFCNTVNLYVNRDIFDIEEGERPKNKFTIGVDFED